MAYFLKINSTVVDKTLISVEDELRGLTYNALGRETDRIYIITE